MKSKLLNKDRLQRADEIVSKVWSHMCGYDLDGKQRDPLDTTGACMKNWQKLHDIVAEHVLRPAMSASKPKPDVEAGSLERVVRHGHRYAYVAGCRCSECVEVNRVYQRSYSRARFRAGIADTHGKTKVPNELS